jgi:hypothetical protein
MRVVSAVVVSAPEAGRRALAVNSGAPSVTALVLGTGFERMAALVLAVRDALLLRAVADFFC